MTAIYNGQVVDLRPLSEKGSSGFVEAYFGNTPTDISLKIKGQNEPIPNIKIKLF